MSDYQYQGLELDLFQNATTWKSYYAARLAPYISGNVLEVGAGIGGTARFLCNAGATTWTCLEPDDAMATRLRAALQKEPLPVHSEVVCGTTASLANGRRFNAILYIDVLEHIEDDRAELQSCLRLLEPGGHLIVLSPAHNWLFSPFDRAIGHFRRYSRDTLLRAAPDELALVCAFYLDSLGMLASLANRLMLRSEYPTAAQIRFWDSTIVPVSKLVDPLAGYRLGKTVIGVWTPRDARRS